MEGLDFSALSDDQLLTLIRASLREITARSPALVDAARNAMLDEAERARLIAEATEREAAKLRAAERARIAEEAAECVREQRSAEMAEMERLRGAEAAEKARRHEIASGRVVVHRWQTQTSTPIAATMRLLLAGPQT